MLAKLGHPGAALDDAYIHFQYARAIAEGHPFRFQAGEPISTGATSFLWPMVLSPFYLVGFRGESILWPAWALAFLALGALSYETYALTKPLAGRGAAIGAGAMTLAFGGLVWGAASGMEVVPFAWLIASATRRASEWAEEDSKRTKRALVTLVLLAFACPLMRPEGAITAVAVALVVFFHPRKNALTTQLGSRTVDISRAEALVFVLAAVFPNLLLLLLTGSATSSTAQVKLLTGNPYFPFADTALANAKTLAGTILDGQVWSAEFLPKGGAPIACLGLMALGWRGHSSGRVVRAALALLLALSMFVPCVYVTFLWNRLRYLWPFAPGWMVGLGCLGSVVGGWTARFIDRRAGVLASTLFAGACAGTFLVRLDWVVEDIAQSASGIDRQQVALGHWAKANLPENARIGVNDTGAIAYFGDRKTFDVVGLTTPTEGRYWVYGAASRLEHYERLERSAPLALPTHFIVYPEWMALDAVLGRALFEATVTDSTILGGQTMRVYEARFLHLGTGERPWTPVGEIVDEVDVADLESEGAHGYQLLGARDGEESVHEGNSPSGALVIDGGRSNRLRDRFFLDAPAAKPGLIGIARLEVSATGPVSIHLNGKEVASQVLEVGVGPWAELTFEVPAEMRGRLDVEVSAAATFISYHYWIATKPAP